MYVAGSMASCLRVVVQEGHTDLEALLVAKLPVGTREIILLNHQFAFILKKVA